MLDFSRVQNYYIACGYTDMRKQIDGLAAVVEMQFGKSWTRHRFFCSAGTVRIGSKHCTGMVQGYVLLYKRLTEKRFSGRGMSRN